MAGKTFILIWSKNSLNKVPPVQHLLFVKIKAPFDKKELTNKKNVNVKPFHTQSICSEYKKPFCTNL